jgi:hypothetical protein
LWKWSFFTSWWTGSRDRDRERERERERREREERREGAIPSALLPAARLHLLKSSEPPKIAPPVGHQAFNT